MQGTRQTAMLADGAIRALRVDVRAISEHAARIHQLSEQAELLQQDALAAAALLSAYLDEDERLTVQMQLEHPRLAFTADVEFDGGIRCRTTPPSILPTELLKGVLLVMKSVKGREVYRGASEIEHISMQDVLQEHLFLSTQVLALVRIEGGIGAFVERLPDESVDPALFLDAAWSPDLGEATALTWSCTCSEEKVLNMLRTLGEAEIRAMIEEDGGAVINCNYCLSETRLGVEQLGSLLADAT